MFIAALFTIVKTWKYLMCPSTDKERVVHLYNTILLSYKKRIKKCHCSNIDGPKDYHTRSKTNPV